MKTSPNPIEKTILAMSLIFAFIYILPLNFRPLAIPDETRYAEIPREMIASGDFTVPHLNGLKYFEKPVLGYWLNAVSIKIFGENPFAVRLTSVISAGLSALLIFFMSAKFIGGAEKGLVASGIFLTFIEIFGTGVFSLLDGMLALFLTICLCVFFLAWDNRIFKKKYYFYLTCSGVFCGLACLTKGFIAFAVPVFVIVPFLIWEGEWKKIFSVAWLPLGVAVIVMLPWGIRIHLKAPDFWNFFFWHEHIKRFLSDHAQHKASFFYFFLVMPLGAIPWIFLAPASIKGLKGKIVKSPFLRYSICWLAFPFLFFSMSSGKLLTYILPCFPPLAILMASGLSAYMESGKKRLFNGGALALISFPAIVIISLAVLQSGIIKSIVPIPYTNAWKPIVFVLVMISFACFLYAAARSENAKKKIALFALAPVLFYFAVNFLPPDETVMRKFPGKLLIRNRDKINKDTLIFSPSTPVRAVCWYFKRSDVFMLDKGELSYGLKQPDAAHRLVSIGQFEKVASRDQGNGKIALVMDANKYRKLKKNLPVPVFMDSTGHNGFIFALF